MTLPVRLSLPGIRLAVSGPTSSPALGSNAGDTNAGSSSLLRVARSFIRSHEPKAGPLKLFGRLVRPLDRLFRSPREFCQEPRGGFAKCLASIHVANRTTGSDVPCAKSYSGWGTK